MNNEELVRKRRKDNKKKYKEIVLLEEDTVKICLFCQKDCKQRMVPRLKFYCFDYEKKAREIIHKKTNKIS